MLRRRLIPVLCALVFAAALSGCGARRSSPSTDLTLLALNPFAGRAVFHLTCGPPGGDLGSPKRACAALADEPQLVTNPKRFTCIGGMSSWWDVTITGRLNGRRVRTHTSTCWTPQMAMIDRLGIGWQALRAHLVPRRRAVLIPGIRQWFPAGWLRPADLVTCTILGHKLEDGVPLEYGTSSTGYGGKNVISVTLSVTHNRDSSVSARCERDDR